LRNIERWSPVGASAPTGRDLVSKVWEFDLRHLQAVRMRIGGAALLAGFAICGIGGACASQDKAQWPHRPALQARQFDDAAGTRGPALSSSQIAPMRYYGGPKSPMWRG
jgi:hypothetical protein